MHATDMNEIIPKLRQIQLKTEFGLVFMHT